MVKGGGSHASLVNGAMLIHGRLRSTIERAARRVPCENWERRGSSGFPKIRISAQTSAEKTNLLTLQYTLGYKQALKQLRSGRSKLLLISKNTPPLRKSELEYYAML